MQPAIPEDVIWTPQAREPFLARITNLINRVTADTPDVIVLPEGAINGLVRYDNRLTDFVRSTVIRTGTPLLFGSYDRQGDAFYNVAIYIDPHNTVTTYRKIRLAPLVEYEPRFFPYRRPSNWLRFTAGTERTVFSMLAGQRFSTMICLEDSMPELGRDFARAGSQLLVSLDSSERFDGTSEPLQQLRRARLTAIAAGLPMVRCANSGISCLINPLGRIEKMLREGRPEAAVVEARLLSLNTVYRITGDWPWLAAMLIAGFGIGLPRRLLLRRYDARVG
ncbi:MAG: apolipoprotein N-acyltransferase [Bryobacteraceae bacterium]